MKTYFFRATTLAASLIIFGATGLYAGQSPQQTLRNLNDAYQGEANATNRYELFAQRAQEEGHPQVEKLFRAISISELIHRENHKRAIQALGGRVPEIVLKPVKVEGTRENLKYPILGEKHEQEEMYPRYIEQARHENAEVAIRTFTYARDAEAQHEKLFREALRQFPNNRIVDYYVNTTSGNVIENKAGKSLSVTSGDYEAADQITVEDSNAAS